MGGSIPSEPLDKAALRAYPGLIHPPTPNLPAKSPLHHEKRKWQLPEPRNYFLGKMPGQEPMYLSKDERLFEDYDKECIKHKRKENLKLRKPTKWWDVFGSASDQPKRLVPPRTPNISVPSLRTAPRRTSP